MDKINFQRIHYFLTVGEYLNFTEAAKKLYITQPALSKQIISFEEEIGIKLFKRTTKEVAFTEGGKIFYDYCLKMYKEMEEVIVQAKKATDHCVYTIRVGLLEMGGIIDYVMPVMDSCLNDVANINLEYFTYGFKMLKEKLKDNELDIVFTLNSEIPEDTHNIKKKSLADLQLCIVVPKKNEFYQRNRLSALELKNKVICTFSDDYSDEARKNIIKHCQLSGFYPSKLKVYPNIQSMMIGMNVHGELTIGYRAFFKEIEDQVKFFPLEDEVEAQSVVMCYKDSCHDEICEVVKRLVEHIGQNVIDE